MDEHINPCKIKRSNPILRKSYQNTNNSEHHSTIKPQTEVETAIIRKHLEDSEVSSPTFQQSLHNHQDSAKNNKHRRTQTDTSTHYSPRQLQESMFPVKISLEPRISKDLRFLRVCHEKAATQNQALIRQISNKHTELNDLNYNLQKMKMQTVEVEEKKPTIEEQIGLPTIRAEENQSDYSSRNENSSIRQGSQRGRDSNSSRKRMELMKLRDELNQVNLLDYLARPQLSYQQI